MGGSFGFGNDDSDNPDGDDPSKPASANWL
jgi:hypothetical protein